MGSCRLSRIVFRRHCVHALCRCVLYAPRSASHFTHPRFGGWPSARVSWVAVVRSPLVCGARTRVPRPWCDRAHLAPPAIHDRTRVCARLTASYTLSTFAPLRTTPRFTSRFGRPPSFKRYAPPNAGCPTREILHPSRSISAAACVHASSAQMSCAGVGRCVRESARVVAWTTEPCPAL
jgi:hypothetical protein